MRHKISVSRGVAFLLGGGVMAISGQAAAGPCPTGSNVVYMSGSSAFKTTLVAAQGVLGSTAQIVYLSPGSCEGLQYLLGTGGNPPGTEPGTAVTVVTASDASCDPPGTPDATTVDIGISDVYPSSCVAGYSPTLNPLTGFKDFPGPIQAMVVAAPVLAQATSISAEAAYMVFHYAADTPAHTVAPWSVPLDIFTRFYDSGTLAMLGQAFGNASGTKVLTAGLWANAQCATPDTAACPNTAGSTGKMQGKITTAAALSASDQNAAIGILGAANITAGIKPLAFQAAGESCGYFPDSSITASTGVGNGDKLNVREGRYAIWGPEHLVVKVDGAGNPQGQNSNTAAVQAVIAALTATSTAPASSSTDGGTALTDTQVGTIIDAISKPTAGVVPQCAMKVQRTSEDGAEASYQPPAPCGCRFMAAATGSAPGCTPCGTADGGTTCSGATPVCRFNYCEAQ
jgi:hypothetical protein